MTAETRIAEIRERARKCEFAAKQYAQVPEFEQADGAANVEFCMAYGAETLRHDVPFLLAQLEAAQETIFQIRHSVEINKNLKKEAEKSLAEALERVKAQDQELSHYRERQAHRDKLLIGGMERDCVPVGDLIRERMEKIKTEKARDSALAEAKGYREAGWIAHTRIEAALSEYDNAPTGMRDVLNDILNELTDKMTESSPAQPPKEREAKP